MIAASRESLLAALLQPLALAVADAMRVLGPPSASAQPRPQAQAQANKAAGEPGHEGDERAAPEGQAVEQTAASRPPGSPGLVRIRLRTSPVPNPREESQGGGETGRESPLILPASPPPCDSPPVARQFADEPGEPYQGAAPSRAMPEARRAALEVRAGGRVVFRRPPAPTAATPVPRAAPPHTPRAASAPSGAARPSMGPEPWRAAAAGDAPLVERAAAPASISLHAGAAAPAPSLHADAAAPAPPEDLDAVEERLAEVLRAAARREGLEV